jgi:hypothetical protein
MNRRGAVLLFLLAAGPATAQPATLTFKAEARVRYDSGAAGQQGLFRGLIGADLRLNPNVRAYGEIGTGQVAARRGAAAANFQNDASLQQLFVDVHRPIGSTTLGATAGRQELADGPRQLISVSDGPNMHRTWNGVRLYAHGPRLRLGAFDLRATRLGRGSFDETIHHGERLQGLNASLAVSQDAFVEPFWLRSRNPLDERDTFGMRLRGRRGDVKYDWTFARQTGDAEAWGAFAVQSVELSDRGWKPRLTARLDIASATFHQLYASSNYLGEGQFLSLRNLVMIAPGVSLTPSPRTSLSVEYGFARRLEEGAPAYAGGMRPYAGTADVPGRELGALLRVSGSWSASEHVTLFFNYEHLDAGSVLAAAPLHPSSYSYAGATFRY